MRPYPYGGATFPQPPSVSVIEFLIGGGKFFCDLSMENLESNSAAEQTQNRDDTNVSREDFGALQHGFVFLFFLCFCEFRLHFRCDLPSVFSNVVV